MDNGVYDILYNTTTEINLAGFLVLYSPLNIETVYKEIIIIKKQSILILDTYVNRLLKIKDLTLEMICPFNCS